LHRSEDRRCIFIVLKVELLIEISSAASLLGLAYRLDMPAKTSTIPPSSLQAD